MTYHADYRKKLRNDTVSLLALIAKGCICTEHTVNDDGLLRTYWSGTRTIIDQDDPTLKVPRIRSSHIMLDICLFDS